MWHQNRVEICHKCGTEPQVPASEQKLAGVDGRWQWKDATKGSQGGQIVVQPWQESTLLSMVSLQSLKAISGGEADFQEGKDAAEMSLTTGGQ